MNKKIRILLILTALIVGFGAVGTWFVLRPSESRMVEIVQDSTVLYVIDLETAENQEIIITSPEGNTNTVAIRNGEIRISDAQCPDHTCVNMGVLYSESLPIVCLPNKLIIRFQ